MKKKKWSKPLIPCERCGNDLPFLKGRKSIICRYCGFVNRFDGKEK